MTAAYSRANHVSLSSLTSAELAAAVQTETITISLSPAQRERIAASAACFSAKVSAGERIYGVNTGFGDSSSHTVTETQSLQDNLIAYHGCGVGENFGEQTAKGILLARLSCLSQGYSGVSLALIDRLIALAGHGVWPVIPCKGSVGASGDLTPLSYLAAMVAGKRQCFYRGKIRASADVHNELGLEPYVFGPREALALINGTSAMTAIAAIQLEACQQLADVACAITGTIVHLLRGRIDAYSAALHSVKPHPGQQHAAAEIAAYAGREPSPGASSQTAVPVHLAGIQDAYSLRCAPHVIGVLYDTLAFARQWVDTELVSVNDNPVTFAETGDVLNGGHFYGGHIAQACDSLKVATANVVGLIDRQVALLMGDRVAEYLSPNLVMPGVGTSHHGFKGMQITLSALAAEALKQAAPMAVFSRPTESGNQDVVSMGTIAARDLARITEDSRLALAIAAMTAVQGLGVAAARGHKLKQDERQRRFVQKVGFQAITRDRPLDGDIVQVAERLFQASAGSAAIGSVAAAPHQGDACEL